VAAVVLALDEGFDLRSRCVLVADGAPRLELVNRDGSTEPVDVTRAEAVALLSASAAAAADAGLAWETEELLLRPADRLVDLISRSHAVAQTQPVGDVETAGA